MMDNKLSRALLVAACALALAACHDRQADAPAATQASADQAGIEKYNEYVQAANLSQSSYGDTLDNFRSYVQPVLDGKKKDNGLSFYPSTGMQNIQAKLDHAQAMQPAMPELDGPAHAYSEALAKAAPLDGEMGNYIAAKTYLSDHGAHGREIEAAYVASMQALTTAQADFAHAIDAKDRARIKAEFEATKKDTAGYFRMGMLYHLKESMDLADGVLDGKGLGDHKDAFKASLDQFDAMANGYEAKVGAQGKAGCSSLTMGVNEYLSTGREIVLRTENGAYRKEAKAPSFGLMQSQERRDAGSLLQHYNNVVSALNVNQC